MKLKNLIGRPVVERSTDFVDGNKTSDESRSGNDSGVGAVLRAARLRIGAQTSEVAQILRIRLPYVEAIENGQYDDLPGLPYEIGFIRAYARHLGLDEDEIVRRYKVENLNKSRKQELVFPAVASENRIPTITNLVLGLMIIGVVYGVWNFNKEANNSFHEMVATLSNHLSFKKQGSNKISSGKSNNGQVSKKLQASGRLAGGKEELVELGGVIFETKENSSDNLNIEPNQEQHSKISDENIFMEKISGAKSKAQSLRDDLIENSPIFEDKEKIRPAVVDRASSSSQIQGEKKDKISLEKEEGQTHVGPAEQAGRMSSGEKIEVQLFKNNETNLEPKLEVVKVIENKDSQIKINEGLTETSEEREKSITAIELVNDNAKEVIVGEENKKLEVSNIVAEKIEGSVSIERTNSYSTTNDFKIEEKVESLGGGVQKNLSINGDQSRIEPETISHKKKEKLGSSELNRVVIIAIGQSWIQIRDDINDKVLMTRLMQIGDRYEVPREDGLQLLTGNAGAIDIFVDGIKVPSIGDIGEVRRRVILDSERLKAGTAVD